MQAEPVAGPELGDAAGDPVGRRPALGEERAPADAPPDRIVPAVGRRVRLVEDERFDGIRDFAQSSVSDPDSPVATLMRTRKQLTREQTRHVQRIQKTLTEANTRLDSVISDVMGVSGRRMIETMIGGQRDPRKLAVRGEVGDPHRVVHVGLAAGNRLDVRGVGEDELERAVAQHLPHRHPVDAGRLHRHHRTPARPQPLEQGQKTVSRRLVRPAFPHRPGPGHRAHVCNDGVLVSVQTGDAIMDHFHRNLLGQTPPARTLHKSEILKSRLRTVAACKSRSSKRPGSNSQTSSMHHWETNLLPSARTCYRETPAQNRPRVIHRGRPKAGPQLAMTDCAFTALRGEPRTGRLVEDRVRNHDIGVDVQKVTERLRRHQCDRRTRVDHEYLRATLHALGTSTREHAGFAPPVPRQARAAAEGRPRREA
jgi:hypothetical protein